MLQSLLQQKRALSVFAAERTLPATLTAHQWELMNKTADVLSPFEELTRDGNLYFYLLLYTVTFIDVV